MTLGHWVTRSCPISSPSLSPICTACLPPTPEAALPQLLHTLGGRGLAGHSRAPSPMLFCAWLVPSPPLRPSQPLSSLWPAPPDPGFTSHCAMAALDNGFTFPPIFSVSIYPFNTGHRALLQGLGDHRCLGDLSVKRARMCAWWAQGLDLSSLPVTSECRGAAGASHLLGESRYRPHGGTRAPRLWPHTCWCGGHPSSVASGEGDPVSPCPCC